MSMHFEKLAFLNYVWGQCLNYTGLNLRYILGKLYQI